MPPPVGIRGRGGIRRRIDDVIPDGFRGSQPWRRLALQLPTEQDVEGMVGSGRYERGDGHRTAPRRKVLPWFRPDRLPNVSVAAIASTRLPGSQENIHRQCDHLEF